MTPLGGPRRLVAALVVSLLAAGCPAQAPTKVVTAADAPRRKASAAPKASPGAPATTPGSPATAGGPSSLPLVPPAPLKRPAGEMIVMRGTVAIDASYAIGSGAAILSNNGGAILATGAGGLVANNGGGVLANNGGNLIANNGGALISDRGASIVANNGGTIIANNTAGVVSTSRYALAQAGATGSGPAPAVGTILPAAGAVLGVVSLQDGAPIAIGEDAKGAPVLAIFTDAAGAYEVYVPAALQGNVLVRVRFPRAAEAVADARLAYDVLTAPKAAAATRVDEDTSLATRYLFEAMAGKFSEFLTTTNVAQTTRALTTAWIGAPPGLQELMLGLVGEFRAEAEKVGLHQAPPAEVRRMARRIIETAISPVDLDTIVVTKESNTLWNWPDELALTGLAAALRGLREGAAGKLATDPDNVAKQPWFAALNVGRTPPLEVKKPADVGEVMVAEYYVRDMWGSYTKAQVVFDSLDARTEAGTGIDQVDRISAVTSAILTAVGQALITDQGGAKTASLGLVRSWQPTP